MVQFKDKSAKSGADTASVGLFTYPILQVSDDGPGGARPEGGSGLRGLADRVAAAGGVLRIESPPGSGTHLEADIPCP
jgi:signal transduction histidine kinase